ncbi:MAG: lysophospholipid acyltransferase family protein [bacterium]
MRENSYHTIDNKKLAFLRHMPIPIESIFYPHLVWYIIEAYCQIKYSTYDVTKWTQSSRKIMRALETVGGRFHITGLDNIRKTKGPAVFISNHMSTLETFILPCLILPAKDLTFILKKSLLSYPIFGSFLRDLKPIVVSRTNPREDLTVVLTEGTAQVQKGKSLVIFPQHTRMKGIQARDFNSLGIKIALKANVPVIPIALKTDFWENGTLIKDLGPLGRSNKDIFIKFGQPLYIHDKGKKEHQQVIEFIKKNYNEWCDNEQG